MKYQPPWTPNGFLISASGTEYCVQREQTLGAQAGGLIYYLMRRRQGEITLEPVGGGLWSVELKDSHGGDMDEWPEDLRIREFPQ